MKIRCVNTDDMKVKNTSVIKGGIYEGEQVSFGINGYRWKIDGEQTHYFFDYRFVPYKELNSNIKII